MTYNLWTYWDNKSNRYEYIDLCFLTMFKNCPNVVILNNDNIGCYLPDLRSDLHELKHIDNSYNNNICLKVDYLKVKILEKYGGIWIDADSIFAKNIDPLFDKVSKHEFVGRKTKRGWTSVGFMGSIHKGKVITQYSKQIDEAIDQKKIFNSASELGARMLTPITEKTPCLLLEKELNPMDFDEWNKYFEYGQLKDYKEAMWFPLYNRAFPDSFKRQIKNEILQGNYLLADIFRSVLNEAT